MRLTSPVRALGARWLAWRRYTRMVRKHLDAGYSLSAETDKMYRDLARQPWPDALDKSISD